MPASRRDPVAQDPLPGSAVRHTAFASATSLVRVNNGPVPHDRGGGIAGCPWCSVGICGRPVEGFLEEYAAAGRLHRKGRQARITADGAPSRSLRRGRMSRGCQCEHGSGQRYCDSHVDHSLMTHRLAPDAACVAPPNGQTCRFAVNSAISRMSALTACSRPSQRCFSIARASATSVRVLSALPAIVMTFLEYSRAFALSPTFSAACAAPT
jgi:hypothetical protein